MIAWAPVDTPTDAQIGAVLDAFEQTAWAGLEADRYAWAAVVHRERGGGAHMHILAARCDLETGRSLNIAPPGWEKTFGPLRDAFNAEHGWSRPDDPARARTQQPGHRAYVEAAQLRAGLALEPAPRDLIRDYLLQRVEHGTVRNRADVVAALHEAGLEVPRQGKNYLTALDPTTGHRWRLTGELYADDFQRERLDRAVALRLLVLRGQRPQSLASVGSPVAGEDSVRFHFLIALSCNGQPTTLTLVLRLPAPLHSHHPRRRSGTPAPASPLSFRT